MDNGYKLHASNIGAFFSGSIKNLDSDPYFFVGNYGEFKNKTRFDAKQLNWTDIDFMTMRYGVKSFIPSESYWK